MDQPLPNIPYLLDTTLRDGSYVSNFQIDAATTYVIVKKLAAAGIPYIETGHGLGLGANRNAKYTGACTDEEWLQASAHGIGSKKFGMFFIPGIGTKDDLRLAKQYNMHFVRIGVDADDWDRAMPFISFAMSLGMEVYLNLMKSHLVQPSYFAEIADIAHANGADGIYIVDSAGHMNPHDVSGYVSAVRDESDIPRIGFHGHNNLQMAVANTMTAVLSGAQMADVSLRGLGRSAGNCQAEAFIIMMQKADRLMQIDLKAIIKLGAEEIDEMVNGWKQTSTDSLLCGKNALHSSFLPIIKKYATKHDLDRYDFIDKVGIMALRCGWAHIGESHLQEVHQMLATWR